MFSFSRYTRIRKNYLYTPPCRLCLDFLTNIKSEILYSIFQIYITSTQNVYNMIKIIYIIIWVRILKSIRKSMHKWSSWRYNITIPIFTLCRYFTSFCISINRRRRRKRKWRRKEDGLRDYDVEIYIFSKH